VVEIVLAALASCTALGVAYIGVLSHQTKVSLNNDTQAMLDRIEHLETLLLISRKQVSVLQKRELAE
jgi:hypothetical protein